MLALWQLHTSDYVMRPLVSLLLEDDIFSIYNCFDFFLQG
jgi:hypothetical protein